MSGPDDEIIAAGTRRMVGRQALRRLGGMVRQWQEEEVAKRELGRRFAAVILVALLFALGAFFWFYR
ncbi:MAG TPA: hypothetical protein VFY24_06175 [Azospira sp.]|nr:hypothetical protein [Azospira sp.]